MKLGRAQPARDASRGRGGLDLVPSAGVARGGVGPHGSALGQSATPAEPLPLGLNKQP